MEKMGFGIAPRRCGIHSKPQLLLQKTFFFHASETLVAYTGMFLLMQLRFQKHKKGKFSTIMAEIWNESHIIWELLQTLFFSTI